MKNFIIYRVNNYKIMNFNEYIKKEALEFENLEELCEELENDKYYHFRVHNNTQYVLFGDIDGYSKGIDKFIDFFINFMKNYYSLNIDKKNIKYTENIKKFGSYHFSVPNYYATTEKQKEIITNFLNIHKDEFCVDGKKIIDSSIYSEHWFRCPNQSKGNYNKDGSKHIISYGNMKDFIIDNIPNKSKSINDIQFKNKQEIIEKNKQEIIEKNKQEIIEKNKQEIIEKNKQEIIEKNNKNDDKKNNTNIQLIEKFINILSSNYYNDYDDWIKVGMILKYLSYKNHVDFFELFNNFSKKSLKYNENDVKKYWDNLKAQKITITIGSLYEFAKKSNSGEYKKILKEFNTKIEISEKYICEKIKEIAGQHFFYLDGNLFSFNTKNDLWYKDTTETLKKFISDDLYDYLFNLLNDSIEDETYLKNQIKELKKYCLINKYTEEILKAFKTRFLNDNDTNNEIQFDNNPYLLGFNNGVYDLKNNIFRKYEFTDYITTRTGYNYKKSSEEERFIIYDLFKKIEVNDDDRYLLWQILSSGLIGKCHQKFIIFDGRGGNGKSVTSNFMFSALGNYAYKGNVQTLCTKQKIGANPEIANMNQKRYVVFSEPESTEKIYNSILKELTGNSKINARKLYDNKCDTVIPATIVLECNDKISLKNDSTDGEIRRIINYTYKSKFTQNKDEINEEEKIFLAKDISDNFIQKYKYAFMDILIEKAFLFINKDKENFLITESVKKSTEKYISSSYQFLTFLDEIAEKSNDDNDYISIADIYTQFKYSDYYLNSTKEEKREKLTAKKMKEFFEQNKITMLHYKNEFSKMINSKRVHVYSVLTKYKYKFKLNDE
jgi:phage/plasmid-associated DNA primase